MESYTAHHLATSVHFYSTILGIFAEMVVATMQLHMVMVIENRNQVHISLGASELILEKLLK